jgi:hypothetical protein
VPQVVWTARPEIAIRGDSVAIAVALPFTRLDVSGRDTLGLRVVCVGCPAGGTGWVSEADVVAEPLPPMEAAGRSLAEFALAVRHAAAWGEVATLVPVMASDFTFGFSSQRDRNAAMTAWQWENFRDVDQVPRLLDAGLVSIAEDFWVAPAAYAENPGYTGLRLGFRRSPETGRWEWLFLVRGQL